MSSILFKISSILFKMSSILLSPACYRLDFMACAAFRRIDIFCFKSAQSCSTQFFEQTVSRGGLPGGAGKFYEGIGAMASSSGPRQAKRWFSYYVFMFSLIIYVAEMLSDAKY